MSTNQASDLILQTWFLNYYTMLEIALTELVRQTHNLVVKEKTT